MRRNTKNDNDPKNSIHKNQKLITELMGKLSSVPVI